MRLLPTVVLALGCCVSSRPPLPDLDDAFRDYSQALPVFPGAEGFGTHTVAGRGGTVYVVDTLADDGVGSLRWALAKPGPRTIIFSVGGLIEATRTFEIHEPFVTIAGQTAPDPGVMIFGAGLSIQTHDVLVQHIALRPGDAASGPSRHDRDALQIIGREDGLLEVFNVVVDHLSLSWSTDEVFSTWYPGVRDITVSHSIIAEAIDKAQQSNSDHSKGFLIGDHTRRLSMIRNVLAHNDDRNPIWKGDTSAVAVNNFIFNPGRWPVSFFDNEGSGALRASLIGNDFVYGPSSQAEHHTVLVARTVRTGSQIYLHDNRGWEGVEQAALIDQERGHGAELVNQAPVSVTPLHVLAVTNVEAMVVPSAGSRPWRRNADDTRIVETIRTRSGQILDHLSEVSVAWPASAKATLSLPPDPNGDTDGDGYTNLEEWLHGYRDTQP